LILIMSPPNPPDDAASDPTTDDIAGLLQATTLARNATQDREKTQRDSPNSHITSIKEAIQALNQPIDTATSQAHQIKTLVDEARSARSLRVADVCSLHQQLAKLTTSLNETAQTIADTTVRPVVRKLTFLGKQSAPISLKTSSLPRFL
jgi:chromosome segregation ATPase